MRQVPLCGRLAVSGETDLFWRDKALAIAARAQEWLGVNGSIRSMSAGSEPISCVEYPGANMVWYSQPLVGDGLKFGQMVMKPGHERFARAALCDLPVGDGDEVHWVLGAVSDHPTSYDVLLGVHAGHDSLVHEAIHYLDFVERALPRLPFQPDDLEDLPDRYYLKAHEFNAFFHQGLHLLLSDERLGLLVSELLPQRRDFRSSQHVRSALRSGAFWRFGFVHALDGRYRRKLLRRIYKALVAYRQREDRCCRSRDVAGNEPGEARGSAHPPGLSA